MVFFDRPNLLMVSTFLLLRGSLSSVFDLLRFSLISFVSFVLLGSAKGFFSRIVSPIVTLGPVVEGIKTNATSVVAGFTKVVALYFLVFFLFSSALFWTLVSAKAFTGAFGALVYVGVISDRHNIKGSHLNRRLALGFTFYH